MKNENSILLRRNKVLLPVAVSSRKVSKAVVAAFNQNIQTLGYTLAPDVLSALSLLSTEAVASLYNQTIDALKEIKGVKSYRPMYPNFPEQVMEASDAELYMNAVIHYWSAWVADVTGEDVIWLPKYDKDARKPLTEKVELTVLRAGTSVDLSTLATNLLTSNTSLSASDKEDLTWLLQSLYVLSIPEVIPNKENMAFACAVLMKMGNYVGGYMKTATDILRLAVALSDGDVSLAETTKFHSFKRGERRTLLGFLNALGNPMNIAEDMKRWKQRWLRLGERLHPGEFSKKFPVALMAFNFLREDTTILTFAHNIEAAVRGEDVKEAVKLLRTRPGDFARRLDHVLRIKTLKTTVDAFADVASEVSTPVLLQVRAHFIHRADSDLRVVFPKGNTAKVQLLENTLPKIPRLTCEAVVHLCDEALKARFSTLPTLGKVYIDPKLKDYLVPFSQRSASRSLRTLVRGSKIAFSKEKDTIRFFMWWKNMSAADAKKLAGDDYWGDSGRVDLDLSATFYNDNWDHLSDVGFYNIRESYSFHSGDITSAPKGASEFIDIDIPKARKNGVRYVMMVVKSYTEQKMVDLPEAFAGWMLREKPQSGEVYEPKTVVDRVDLTAEGQMTTPLIIDLKERKVIWADMPMPTNKHSYVTARANRNTIQIIGRAFTEIYKPTLYDLFTLHAEARGKMVKTEAAADTIFSVAAGTPYELDTIASQYMANAVKPKRDVVSV